MDSIKDFNNIENILPGKICYIYNDEGRSKAGVLIYQNKEKKIGSTHHSDLLKLGYAKFDKKKTLPTHLKDLKEISKKAETAGIGLWAENEASDDEEEEENY